MRRSVKQKVDNFYAQYPQRRFGKGQILVYAGDEPSGVYYLQTGQVRQYDITESGNEVVVNAFKPPSFFPVSWALNKTPNLYFYESFTPVKIRTAPADAVVEFLKSNHDVTLDLLQRVYSGVDGMTQRMAYMMGGNTKNRVLYELILECKRFGKLQKNGSYRLELHEDELANRAGLARETVGRHIQKLNHGELIDVGRKYMTIHSLDRLQKELDSEVLFAS